MFGKKKVKSLRKQNKEEAKRYEHTVSCAVKNYIHLINNEKSKGGKAIYTGQLDGFLNAVRMTDEYKHNSRRFEKIIKTALNSDPKA